LVFDKTVAPTTRIDKTSRIEVVSHFTIVGQCVLQQVFGIQRTVLNKYKDVPMESIDSTFGDDV